MEALVGAFNQEKALEGAFSVIVKTDCGTDGSFYSTTQEDGGHPQQESSLSVHHSLDTPERAGASCGGG